MTAPSQYTYAWTFVPRLADARSWSGRPFKSQPYKLAELYTNICETLDRNQVRGMVRFKSHHDQVKKLGDASLLGIDDEICASFTCKQHLEAIIKGCDRYAIPPTAIQSVVLFNIGYFIH
jgi:hypothetical protein